VTTPHARFVVVGVVPGQPPAVVAEAARFAAAFGAELVCALVDPSRYPVPGAVGGEVQTTSIDPDLADDAELIFDPEVESAIAKTLAKTGVCWTVRALAGGPAVELARLADELDAIMIVVGTREAGFRGTLHEFFSGSVAAQLAHHQHRPVVVVPLRPVGIDEPPFWQGGVA
jgi:nucleotide-binding universal stress UspA family protein